MTAVSAALLPASGYFAKTSLLAATAESRRGSWHSPPGSGGGGVGELGQMPGWAVNEGDIYRPPHGILLARSGSGGITRDSTCPDSYSPYVGGTAPTGARHRQGCTLLSGPECVLRWLQWSRSASLHLTKKNKKTKKKTNSFKVADSSTEIVVCSRANSI